MEKPYVISAELGLYNPRVTPLIREETLEKVRESLDADLRAMGKNTIWMAAGDIQRGINSLVKQSKLPVLSLDDRYVSKPDGRLGISRGVDESLNGADYVPRARYPELEKQFDLAAELGNEVQLVDDVLFSGDMMLWVTEQLKRRNIRVGRVVCGIAIDEGLNKLDEAGMTVDAVSSFSDVEDEICERDFFIVPGSGRRIASQNENVLYFDDWYGKPTEWASIPEEKAQRFFVTSLERSRQLIRSGTQMLQIGKFKGFDSDGDALESIENRILGEL